MVKAKQREVKYYLNRDNEFVIENYNFSRPFANFFPGIAGKYGIPIWVFYCNRGQGISSFGTKDKDHAILEFFPANKTWALTSTHGFRTFIKVKNAKSAELYQPFQNGQSDPQSQISNRMRITSYDLKIEEENPNLGLSTKVEYFTIPNDSYGAMVRAVTIKNTSKKIKNLQIIDGLPQINPFGTNNWCLKEMSRTIEAWMKVENLENNAAFYKLAVDPSDRPEVIHINEGNFFLGFHFNQGKAKLLRPIVDPQSVFGPATDFSHPYEFMAADTFNQPKKELTDSKTPSALLLLDCKLSAGEEKTFYSITGYMRNLKALNSSLARIIKPGYLTKKAQENKCLIENLQNDISTTSSSKEFDLYTKQTYLDNILRGGYPLTFKSGKVFYLYSRKHGDIERDYNKFHIQPAYFSQGNGNYRDVNQNRRCDTWFNPEVKEDNIVAFLNLLQSDGFNQLVVKGATFSLNNPDDFRQQLNTLVQEKHLPLLLSFLNQPFTPGEVILFIEDNLIKINISYDEFLEILIANSRKIQEAEHGEGFWSDHWAYNLDLLENYLAIYPDNLTKLIFENKDFIFFDNNEIVRPRNEKYQHHEGKILQLHSVIADSAKKEMLKKRTQEPHASRAMHGMGEIYHTTLINKLFCLAANKLASLDPSGIGIEMEANKPNWYDALNGLPGLFGSSANETFELKRLILFIKEAFEKSGAGKIFLSEEIYELLFNLGKLIEEYLHSDSQEKDYLFWDKSYTLKEDYRHKTKFGFSGSEVLITEPELKEILDLALAKLDQGLLKAKDEKSGIYYSYFFHEITEHQELKNPFVKPVKFKLRKLPFFLEGNVHALKLMSTPAEAKSLYKAIKQSLLFDKTLKMYKVTAPLKEMPEEIGRCRVFAPGWLENESIWLHMEYKYLLEIIKQGLYEEFYGEFKNLLIPFQKPQKYGRSILENSSFIVSSAFTDKKLWGNGFVARLSGSTAEFLQIWLLMNLGNAPFCINENNELTLKFAPCLAGWLFNKKTKTYSFNFLSSIKVTYHNPKLKNTFGKTGCSIKKISFNDRDNRLIELSSGTIPSPYAQQIRSRQIKQIDICLE